MTQIIKIAKEIIKKQVDNHYVGHGDEFLRAHKVYPWTNEDINTYLKLADFNDKDSALSVLASGDQPFNLVTNGILNIDTFDINPLSEYYSLGLKRALILKYDFDTFNGILNILYNPWTSIDVITSLIKSLFPYMERKHKNFWETILDYNYKYQKRNGTLLNIILLLTLQTKQEQNELNNYLMLRQNYELLRSRLASSNISFRCTNALNLGNTFKRKYDLILLSNILDYFYKYLGPHWNYNKLQEYEKSLENLGESDAIIFLHYILHYLKNNKPYRISIIDNCAINPADLTDEQLITLPSGTSVNHGMILKRVDNCQKEDFML